MRESEDMPAWADMNKDVIYPQLIANFINKMRHDYIKPQLWAHSTPFGLSDDGYLQFDDEYTKSGRWYLKDAWDTNVCVLKNRETLGISNGDKSAKSTLITFLNLLYIQKI